MIRIAICDDISIHCEIAKDKLISYFEKVQMRVSIDLYTTGRDLLQSNKYYDLLIMDIALKNENGMDIAKQYVYGKHTRVILLSSHQEEMANGYKIKAFRFLVKPINDSLLQEALDSALTELAQEEKLLVFNEKKEYAVFLSDILYVEAAHKKSYVRTIDQLYTCPQGIQQIAATLKSPAFFMPFKSYIVNMQYIRSFHAAEILLCNGERIPLSRLKREDFKKKYQNYIRSKLYDI